MVKDTAKESKYGNLYRPFLEALYKDEEIESNEMDLQQMMSQLNKEKLDYDKVFTFMRKRHEGTLNAQELDEIEAEEKIVRDKMKEAESSKAYIQFFNPGTKMLMENTPSDVLSELGIRAYTGSRDVPKDDNKASGLLKAALERA